MTDNPIELLDAFLTFLLNKGVILEDAYYREPLMLHEQIGLADQFIQEYYRKKTT